MRFVLVGLLLAACRPGPTEIVVTVDTTFGVPCTIDTVVFETTAFTESVAVTDADLPGSLTFTSDHDELEITVSGLRDGEVFAVAHDVATFDDRDSLEMRFLLDRACVPGPCPAIGLGGFEGLPERAIRRGCGASAYVLRDTLVPLRDACDIADAVHIAGLTNADEIEAPFTIPFPFSLYGEPATTAWISDNGYIGFSAAPPDALTNHGGARSLGDPSGSFPERGILPFWDDLRTGPNGVCAAVTGESPDRLLWITWREACFKAGTTPCGAVSQGVLTFTAALEETTDRVYVGYQEMAGSGGTTDRARGQSATIGITDDGAAACAADACTPAGTCPSGEPCGYTELSSGKVTALRSVEMVPQ